MPWPRHILTGSELEYILHPSRGRLQVIGACTIVGHLLFWGLWAHVVVQPYENLQMRLLMASTGLGLLFWRAPNVWQSQSMRLYFVGMSWLQLPFFFIWMYWMNMGSAVWLSAVAAMVIMYYHLTDWRIASLGLIFGSVVSSLLADYLLAQPLTISAEHGLVFLFSWGTGLLLALSSANLRRERAQQSLVAIGIMAHEVRTPLATLSLVAQALRVHSDSHGALREKEIQDLAGRIDKLVHTIHHHIDLQMANARLGQQVSGSEWIDAASLVSEVLSNYPFGSSRERQCVELVLHDNFSFKGGNLLFSQVLENLLKNALHSLKAAQSRFQAGDIRIEIGQRENMGRIQIRDRGMGIDSAHLNRIFEPFFSTRNETGHGLGLAFCKQVIQAAGGEILVQSAPAVGATFILQLPCIDSKKSTQLASYSTIVTPYEVTPVPSP